MKNFDASQLSHFTGTERYYRISRRHLLTDGTKYLVRGAACSCARSVFRSLPQSLPTSATASMNALFVREAKLNSQDGQIVLFETTIVSLKTNGYT